MRSRSSLVGPARLPLLRSDCRSQLRSVSPVQPILAATELIAALAMRDHPDAAAPSEPPVLELPAKIAVVWGLSSS